MDTKNNKLGIINQEQYDLLVEDCRATITERVKNSRWELIMAYAEVGERIVNDDLYKKFGKGNQVFLNKLFNDIGIGNTNGYYAVNFYQKYFQNKVKDVSTGMETIMQNNFLKEGSNISWNKIKTNYLPEPKENKIRLSIPKGKYGLVVIDPPWNYGTEYNQETRRVASPYEELPQDELKKIVISSAKDCVLWLWTTHKFLWDAKELLEHWGFEYKLTLVWNKEKLGMGAWLRCQTEFCLLGIKGSPEWNLTNERDIIIESRREHSRKPIAFYEMIKKLTPVKGINMFGRESIEGFDTWGNESEKF